MTDVVPEGVGTSIVSVLGIFNTSDRKIWELFQIEDFPETDPTKAYIIKSSFGMLSDLMGLGDPSLISVQLDVYNYEFLSAYPLTALESTQDDHIIYVATLGLQGKMLGAAPIIGSSYSIEDGALHLNVVLKTLGTLGKQSWFCIISEHYLYSGT